MKPAKNSKIAQSPLLLRCHRLMDAFSKSDDERDFYLDKTEGFLIYVDLDKSTEELEELSAELEKNEERYALVPKMTFYETKKIMEGFVNEKVYDIDTKEKLLDIIQSKDPREHFLEFIYDQHTELEKWQQYFQERSRIRIIEWLRNWQLTFVFEEDLDLPKQTIEKLKECLFEAKVSKDLAQARAALVNKSKVYYSNEALNPRPKRGRPPKQTAKVEVEPVITADIYHTVSPAVRRFLYCPEITSASEVTFSAKFDSQEAFLASMRTTPRSEITDKLEEISERLASLRKISKQIAPQDLSAVSPAAAQVRISDEMAAKKRGRPPKTFKF